MKFDECFLGAADHNKPGVRCNSSTTTIQHSTFERRSAASVFPIPHFPWFQILFIANIQQVLAVILDAFSQFAAHDFSCARLNECGPCAMCMCVIKIADFMSFILCSVWIRNNIIKLICSDGTKYMVMAGWRINQPSAFFSSFVSLLIGIKTAARASSARIHALPPFPYMLKLNADAIDLFSFYRSGSVVWMNDVVFIALLNVFEVELIWTNSVFFFVLRFDWAESDERGKKNRLQMSLLMIRLYALYAFAIDLFSLDVRLEWDDSYVASNPERKKNWKPKPTDQHIREFRFLLFIYFRNVRNDIHSPMFLIMEMVVSTAKQIEPQQKRWIKSENLLDPNTIYYYH